jgi:nucleotide-binding universal stress UspA family protein
MFKDILVYVEIDKPFSWEKPLPKAVELCQQWGATLHVLTAVPDYGMPIVQQYFPEGFEDEVTASTLEELKAWLAEKVPDGVRVQPNVAEGKARAAILRIAEVVNSDLIVLSPRRQFRKDCSLGATAAHVARHACCSVLIAR